MTTPTPTITLTSPSPTITTEPTAEPAPGLNPGGRAAARVSGVEPAAAVHADADAGGLAGEVRQSLLLLGLAVGVTVGLTTAAQAALAVLH